MMHRKCSIKVYEDSGIATIEILGDLTASAEADMEDAYEKACGYDAGNILFKFDSKGRINSSGIAIMINLVIESQEEGRRIFITGISSHFRKIFELVGLTKYTTIVDSEEEIGEL